MQAGTYFPKVRRMLLCFSPLILEHIFSQPPRCFAGTLLLPLSLLLRPFLKFWSVGVTLMRFTWANHSKRWILVSNVCMTYDGFGEFYTSDWIPIVWALFHKIDKDFGGSVSLNTQPNCRVWVNILNKSPCSMMMLIILQHSHCTVVTIFLDLFLACSSTWRCA